MRGIELLLERKLPLSLKTMLMTINRHELEQMQDLARDLGVEYRFDPMVNPALDGSTRPIAIRLSPEEIVAIERTDPGRASHWPQRFRQVSEVKYNTSLLYLCGAGKNSFFIDSAGQLSLCVSSRNPSYNLMGGNFQEGWDRFLSGLSSRQHSKNYPCADCELRNTCNQCPAMAELEYGDSEKRVEFLCQVTKLRREAFAL
jgi:radical SAM protein with 4Fe4S-binding SPASM domain